MNHKKVCATNKGLDQPASHYVSKFRKRTPWKTPLCIGKNGVYSRCTLFFSDFGSKTEIVNTRENHLSKVLLSNTVKPVIKATSIKQSPVLKG